MINRIKKHYRSEFLFQGILIILLWLIEVVSNDESNDKWHNEFDHGGIWFFLSYVLAALFINYVLLPRLLYAKKYLGFALSLTAVLALVIVNEELILEKIYFPDTRGKWFRGIGYTFLEVIPVIAILVGFKFAWDANKKQREVENLTHLVQSSELEFLKSQINPHFLFNNLNNLYSYAISGSTETPDIILKLSNVLRYMLYDCREDFVPLEKEIDHLRSFTSLSALQIGNRGEVNFTSDKAGTLRIAPLILSVFIENAFKHSTSSQSGNIKIDIDLGIDPKGMLLFSCVNNYQQNSNTQNLSKGIGLTNVQKRLQLLYPNSHELDISEDGTIFSVRLKLQLK
ncbi:sensor histidine kinase [Sediminicola luteus]|uniref:Histidine kinase n=1 Tax=Sediminicola luteus TaxID=319238 RepID=A0A2A4G3U0_9FLAO|nr:histidine kinase [Sediminicola luteus]PCE62630.1 histidine kinase [Sediminicola luteus]